MLCCVSLERSPISIGIVVLVNFLWHHVNEENLFGLDPQVVNASSIAWLYWTAIVLLYCEYNVIPAQRNTRPGAC